jgi:hypothetical protein
MISEEVNFMRKAMRAFILLASLLALMSQPSLAGDVTLFAGIQNPGKLTIANIPRDTATGGVFGARFGGGRVVGFEQTVAYSPKFLESGRRAFNTQSNFVVNIPTTVRVTPYGTVGIGVITTFGDSIRDFEDIGAKFTVNYGGGLKFRNLAGPMGLRVDVRGYSVPSVFDQTLNFVEASIGVLFSW